MTDVFGNCRRILIHHTSLAPDVRNVQISNVSLCPWADSADDKLGYFSYLLQKID